MEKQCDNCRFFQPASNPRDTTGLCRKHTPVIFVYQSMPCGVWPSVEPTDWCGEFEGREKKA